MKNFISILWLVWLVNNQVVASELHPSTRKATQRREDMGLHAHLPTSTITTFTSGASWQYLVATSAPDPSWKNNLLFNDTSAPWYAGSSPLGYGGQGASSTSVTSEGGTCINQCVSGTVTTPGCLTCTTKEITT
ncbi:hypothetical protein, partial [Spirosoma harenae]